MDEDGLRAIVRAHVARSSDLAAVLVSAIWIGSLTRGSDTHPASDVDLQFVLEHPDEAALAALSSLLMEIPGEVDLSVIYLDDILGNPPPGRVVDFQDGTKGEFFVFVLAHGVTLYGENPYPTLVPHLSPEKIDESLRFTVREYAARLRVLALLQPFDARSFSKYSLKLLKDLLALAGVVAPNNLAGLSYENTKALVTQCLSSTELEARAIESLGTVGSPIPFDDRLATLAAIDRLCHRVLRESLLYGSE